MKKDKKYIVILGAGILQLPFIKRASEDYSIILIDENANAVGREYGEVFWQIPFSKTRQISEKLDIHKEKILAVTTIATDFSLEAAMISENLGIESISPKIGQVTTSKEKMRIFFQDHGYSQPDFIASDNLNDLYLFMETDRAENNGYVIKPVRNMGARGVQYVKDSTHLLYSFEYAQKFSRNKRVILEEYIPTKELSVDALCFEGKVVITGIADREIELSGNRYFIERGHDMPSVNYEKIYTGILNLFQKICDDFGRFQGFTYHGPLKGDIKYSNKDDGSEFIIGEIASRLSGGYMSTHTYPASFNVSLMDLYLKHLEYDKEVLNAPKDPVAYSCEMNFEAEPGALKKITEKNEILSSENTAVLQEVFYPYKTGDLIFPLRNNVGKAAHLIIEAKSRADLDHYKQKIRNDFSIETSLPLLSDQVINERAKTLIPDDICSACDICDGKNCASNVPGMGGRGDNVSFYNNYRDLQTISILLNKINEADTKEVDLSFDFINNALSMPIMTAPITGSVTNLGGAITEWELAEEISIGAKHSGTLAFLGDGATPKKFYIALKNQQIYKNTIPVFKPRKNQDEIKFRISEGITHGITAWGMDIDSAGLITMKNKHQKTSKKTSEELRQLSNHARIPFVVKGVLSIEDAHKAIDANAAAVIVSNHGGRVDDRLPSSISQLPIIKKYIQERNENMKIFIDGGFRSGRDVFRALALGADAVLVGRPIAIAAVAYGRFGVYSVLTRMKNELSDLMKKLHIESLHDITHHHVDASRLFH